MQEYEESQEPGVVGKDMKHASADKQVSGQAMYVDDLPRLHNELYGAIVPSSKAHAIIK